MEYQFDASYALKLDKEDELAKFRAMFYIPEQNGQPVNYFTGNSLGLQPKTAGEEIQKELDSWSKRGVEGHFDGDRPWFNYHSYTKEAMAGIVGALPNEVVVMNSLTVNLHLLMVSFYRPTSSRYKIIMEAGAFPSDQYAIESQVKFHGYTEKDAIVELEPRPGELTLRSEDIIDTITKTGDKLALVLIGGVQYFTGQLFNMPEITKAGHGVGAKVGFDLAHAAGNVDLSLHDWGVDFAVWCTYKYLNSGPGNLAGAFVHEKHENNQDLPRFAGWWGHKEDERFLMKKGFIPMTGADGWQLSNSNVLAAAAVLASMKVFKSAGFEKLRMKSKRLTGYAEFLIEDIKSRNNNAATIVTPSDSKERGCQLSLAIAKNGKEIFNELSKQGVVTDWREPNLADDQPGIIRIAPVPLYNSFTDVFEFAKKLEVALIKK